MKTIEEIKQIVQEQKSVWIEKHRVRKIGIFGSYVRGDQKNDSDLDILIDFDEYPGLLEFLSMENDLSQRLGIKVDLVMKSGLKPVIGERILNEVIYL